MPRKICLQQKGFVQRWGATCQHVQGAKIGDRPEVGPGGQRGTAADNLLEAADAHGQHDRIRLKLLSCRAHKSLKHGRRHSNPG